MDKISSIIARLNPKSSFTYICKEERNTEGATIFYLRGLSVFERRKCEELSSGSDSRIGEFNLQMLIYGLVGWDKFTWENGELIPFSLDNFSSLRLSVQLELAQEILNLSDVDDDLEDELIMVARWSDYLSKSKKPEQWICESCIANKQDKARNCDGTMPNRCVRCNIETQEDECPQCGKKTNPHFKMRVGVPPLHFNVTRCPVSILSHRAIRLTNLINYMENSKALPFAGGALEQTNFFYNVRMIILSEQSSLLKNEIDISKSGNKG